MHTVLRKRIKTNQESEKNMSKELLLAIKVGAPALAMQLTTGGSSHHYPFAERRTALEPFDPFDNDPIRLRSFSIPKLFDPEAFRCRSLTTPYQVDDEQHVQSATKSQQRVAATGRSNWSQQY